MYRVWTVIANALLLVFHSDIGSAVVYFHFIGISWFVFNIPSIVGTFANIISYNLRYTLQAIWQLLNWHCVLTVIRLTSDKIIDQIRHISVCQWDISCLMRLSLEFDILFAEYIALSSLLVHYYYSPQQVLPSFFKSAYVSNEHTDIQSIYDTHLKIVHTKNKYTDLVYMINLTENVQDLGAEQTTRKVFMFLFDCCCNFVC